MKPRTSIALIWLALLVYFGGSHTASAFYDPGTQRWLNRDPRGESGSIVLRYVKIRELNHEKQNLFLFALNNPLYYVDPFGLYDWGYPFSGSVNNCSDKPVIVLIDGRYYTLAPGQATPPDADVDGVWIDGKFYKVSGGSTVDTCNPPGEMCKPKSRGAPTNNPPPPNLPPYTPPKWPVPVPVP
jgi:RHS repeat-associated protein